MPTHQTTTQHLERGDVGKLIEVRYPADRAAEYKPEGLVRGRLVKLTHDLRPSRPDGLPRTYTTLDIDVAGQTIHLSAFDHEPLTVVLFIERDGFA